MTEEQQPEETASTDAAKCEEYKAGWKRALADYDNLRKDLARERMVIREQTTSRLCESFLSVLEHFDQALSHQPKDMPAVASGWAQGVLHVRIELENALRELGVEPFGTVGEAFDPRRHEAVSERVEGEKENNTVIEVIGRGFALGERVLRPARVIVSKRAE
ncbi:nucleotide exchange factor GrpE [Candidatus Uhrbacteria bacterium]|nr:nucleotide exchange factor GrpE [Candidatus Uhrbacteria bacterium]